MKNKLLDYLLLETNLYKKPIKKRSLLLFLCAGAGLVIMLGYFARYGFGFWNNIYSIITTAVLVFFCGIFSMVVFSWPITDFAVAMSREGGKLFLTVKRMKIVKGFLFAVIYTGAVSTLLKILAISVLEINAAIIASAVISVGASIWAGAIITRCITAVFEETAVKKMFVFFVATAWYYIIIVRIMGFIIKGAYSIIL